MTTWVPCWDESYSPVPVSQYPEAYRDGMRVMMRYVGAGGSGKQMTAAQKRAWLSQGPDTGICLLVEREGDEPLLSDAATLGRQLSLAGRAGARALGYPDGCTLIHAVDRNISLAQAAGTVEAYFAAAKAADTCLPGGYIERDGGELLLRAGVIGGYGTPAAYLWDPSGVLFTPANAPAGCWWTQEHNGVSRWGGDVDLGHIRTSAPIMWRTTQLGDGEIDMTTVDLTPAAITAVRDAILAAGVWARPAAEQVDGPGLSLAWAVRQACLRSGKAANDELPALATTVQTLLADEAADAQALGKLASAVADLPGAGPGGTLTINDIVDAMTQVIAREQISVTVAPAAGSGS